MFCDYDKLIQGENWDQKQSWLKNINYNSEYHKWKVSYDYEVWLK